MASLDRRLAQLEEHVGDTVTVGELRSFLAAVALLALDHIPDAAHEAFLLELGSPAILAEMSNLERTGA